MYCAGSIDLLKELAWDQVTAQYKKQVDSRPGKTKPIIDPTRVGKHPVMIKENKGDGECAQVIQSIEVPGRYKVFVHGIIGDSGGWK